MSMLWDKFLTEEDKAVLARGKFGRRKCGASKNEKSRKKLAVKLR